MAPAAGIPDQPGGIDAIPENLLREPIDYLYADHFRQQSVCGFLECVALDPAMASAQPLAREVLAYLEQELPRHVADEEEDLFPLLLQRCSAEDRIQRVQHLLGEEHRREDGLSATVIEGLRSIAAGHPPDRPGLFQRAAAAMAEGRRRHLAWENEFLLPLARERLMEEDLEAMGRSMAERRGADYPD